MGMWKTLRVSHIPTPPTTTTGKYPTRRYTNIPLGTKDRSGQVDIEIVKVKLGYVLPALIVAVAFRIFKAHDRISDIFGIRRNFDVQEILVPLAGEANFPVNLERLASLQRNRSEERRVGKEC